MTARDILGSAFRGLSANRLRSGLTVLGILIGVAAVIMLIAVGNGSKQAVADSISSLGSNTVTVSSSGGRGGAGPNASAQASSQDLTFETVAALEDPNLAPDVKTVTPVASASTAVTYGSQSSTVSVTGTTASWFEASNSPVASGQAFTDVDVDNGRRVAVVGTTTADNLFNGEDPLGKSVSIGGVNYTVVGILASKDSSGPNDANASLVAPISAVQDSLSGYGGLSSVIVQATSADTVDAVQDQTEQVLNQMMGTTSSTANYRILNQSQLLEAQTDTAGTFTVLLAAVAAISLLVGGIGVTNIMLVTVTERTREIGIRKALGAQRGSILLQFLAEATALSLVGGALGVMVALIGSQFEIAGIEPAVVPASIALAFFVAAAIGVFFGSYPASRASRLLPVEALRYQ